MSSRPIVRVVAGVAAGLAVVTALIAIQPPAWIVLLLGSIALAGLYVYARMNSRYDPLDPAVRQLHPATAEAEGSVIWSRFTSARSPEPSPQAACCGCAGCGRCRR